MRRALGLLLTRLLIRLFGLRLWTLQTPYNKLWNLSDAQVDGFSKFASSFPASYPETLRRMTVDEIIEHL